MRTLVLAAAIGLVSASAVEAQQIRSVDALVAPYIGTDAPGIAVLVTRNGLPIHMQGYGVADIESGRAVDSHTLFELASVSKQMTGLAAMLLIEDGKLTSDTSIAAIIPAFASYGTDNRPLVVADLLHHLGGLPDYLGYDFDYEGDTTDAEVIAQLATQQPLSAPGISFVYSNTGYVLLASTIAAADRATDLRQVLHRRVWDVLGMKETDLVHPVHPAAMATGYAGTDGNFTASSWPNLTQGDGNVFTSISDLALYERALDANSLLAKSGGKRLFENGRFDNGAPIDDGEGAGYGFGWVIETWEGARYAWHNGSWYGTATAYVRNLDTGVSVIVLSNGEDLDVTTLAFDIEAAAE